MLLAPCGCKSEAPSTAPGAGASVDRTVLPLSEPNYPAITELDEKRRLPPEQLKAREAALILAALPAGATLLALDETGSTWSSRELADRLAAWRDGGVPALAFAIGGANGLGSAVIERADCVLSLGRMTWPHLLIRCMLLEQLYRAQQILVGHPYHRD